MGNKTSHQTSSVQQTPDDWRARANTRITQNVGTIFRENQAEIQQIRNRTRLIESNLVSARDYPRPTSAYQAVQDVTNKFNLFKKLDKDQLNLRLTQNVDNLLRDSDRKLRDIQTQRAKLEASQLTKREVKKPSFSLPSLVDLSLYYKSFKTSDLRIFSPKPERPELTDEMLIAIKHASRSEPANEPLTEIDGVQILRKDMRTLTNLNWLNDEIINAYFHLIVMRGRELNRKSVYAFNTFFYPRLRDSGYASVKRWTRKVDIFSYDFLLVPIHLGNHWCLAFIDVKTKKSISYYDSLGGSTNNCCDILLNYLKCESNDKKKQNLDDENWKSVNCYVQEGIPQQLNGSDCGVFACQFAEHLSRGAKLKFTQEHMPYFRRKMIYELLTKRLLE